MNRRTLLTRIAAAFSVVAAGGLSVPFLKSLMPGFQREILLDVDVSTLAPGEYRRVRWLGRHVFIVRRPPEAVASLTEQDASREDPGSVHSNQPVFARNRTRSRDADHLLVYANCTHLGCEVEVVSDSEFRGFRCPCHRSEFDAAGRVEQGAAAKLNLEVPDYQYISSDVIRLIDA